MRCLTLAQELRRNGFNVALVCRAYPGNIISRIESQDIPVHTLSSVEEGGGTPTAGGIYERWLQMPQEEDAEVTIAVLDELDIEPDWLIVDHYSLDRRWETMLRPKVKQLMVIDDLANRSHDCDLLLDQNYYRYGASRYRDLINAHCKCLFGPQYALLRDEFRISPSESASRDGTINRALICFGGIDKDNETEKAIRALGMLDTAGLTVDVILGRNNEHAAAIEPMSAEVPNVRIHRDVNNIAEHMKQADLSIGAGGTMIWERCCLGLPSLVIAIARNQVEIAREAHRLGVIRHLGAGDQVTAADILRALQTFLDNPESLQTMSIRAMQLVDGKGALRVANVMMDRVGTGVTV